MIGRLYVKEYFVQFEGHGVSYFLHAPWEGCAVIGLFHRLSRDTPKLNVLYRVNFVVF